MQKAKQTEQKQSVTGMSGNFKQKWESSNLFSNLEEWTVAQLKLNKFDNSLSEA